MVLVQEMEINHRIHLEDEAERRIVEEEYLKECKTAQTLGKLTVGCDCDNSSYALTSTSCASTSNYDALTTSSYVLQDRSNVGSLHVLYWQYAFNSGAVVLACGVC